jgi:hypothetical protein
LHEGKGVRAYITTAFGCPYEGDVAIAEVVDVIPLSKKNSLGVPFHGNISALNRDIDTSKPMYYTSSDYFAVLLLLTPTQPFTLH